MLGINEKNLSKGVLYIKFKSIIFHFLLFPSIDILNIYCLSYSLTNNLRFILTVHYNTQLKMHIKPITAVARFILNIVILLVIFYNPSLM